VPSFQELFGRPPTARASAPGRINLIGDHTDYNGGFVMPVATPQYTTVEVAARDDDLVRLWSDRVSTADHLSSYRLNAERSDRAWFAYASGVTSALLARGCVVRGFDARITSTLPMGAGLASSAALEVSVIRALNDLFHLGLAPSEVARAAHEAETRFVGAPVGVMDQMAAVFATETAALFLDTATLEHERIPLPSGTALMVIDSGIAHAHATGEYKARRAECDRAAALLGVKWLRDVPTSDPRVQSLPPPLDRRVRHVLTENARVLAAREATLAGDATALGVLMNQSHASLRDDFEVSIPEIDRLVEDTLKKPGVLGARLTGGGFGGSIVALTRTRQSS